MISVVSSELDRVNTISLGSDHAKFAVNGFVRAGEETPCSAAGERGEKLASNVIRFTHVGAHKTVRTSKGHLNSKGGKCSPSLCNRKIRASDPTVRNFMASSSLRGTCTIFISVDYSKGYNR